jgi:multidrug efflux pump subunit AcrA (membrane-fusion protein)
LEQAKAALSSSEATVEAERQGLAVLESQDTQLRADLAAKEAALDAAHAHLAYTRINAPADGMEPILKLPRSPRSAVMSFLNFFERDSRQTWL